MGSAPHDARGGDRPRARSAILAANPMIQPLTTVPSPLEQLQALYAELPTIVCRGLCDGACGPVMVSRLEVEQLGAPLTFHARTLRCVFLTDDRRCVAYDQRPMICRVYGMSRGLPCAHGCVPDRWLTEAEGREFVARAMTIGGGMVVPDRAGPP